MAAAVRHVALPVTCALFIQADLNRLIQSGTGAGRRLVPVGGLLAGFSKAAKWFFLILYISAIGHAGHGAGRVAGAESLKRLPAPGQNNWRGTFICLKARRI